MLTVYILMRKGAGEIEEESLVVLSDESHHGTASVYTCYQKLQSWLKQEYPNQQWTHTYLVTDGCGGEIVF